MKEENVKEDIGYNVPLSSIDLVWDQNADMFRVVYYNAYQDKIKDMATGEIFNLKDNNNFSKLDYYVTFGALANEFPHDKITEILRQFGGILYDGKTIKDRPAFQTYYMIKAVAESLTPEGANKEEKAAVLDNLINKQAIYLDRDEEEQEHMSTVCGYGGEGGLQKKFLNVIKSLDKQDGCPLSPEVYVHPDIKTMYTERVRTKVKIRRMKSQFDVLNF